ncbi:MAG TPA: tripartite tricarboxylate transporter TctB family protein [bacterium]|nr:tripartite tricarboxylate transporter TctB family protein [bacterium]
MRDRNAFLFSAGIALVGLWALWQTEGWAIKSWLYPRVILLPLIALAVAEAALTFRGKDGGSREGQPAADIELESTVDPALAVRRTWLAAVWILGLFLAVILIGFQAAVPLFVLAYLRAHREGWLLGLALAAFSALAFHGLFVYLLHLPLPPGLLLRMIGR